MAPASAAARLLAAALAAASAAALYDSGDGVLQIASEKEWNDKVIKAPGLFLVECASAARGARSAERARARAQTAQRRVTRVPRYSERAGGRLALTRLPACPLARPRSLRAVVRPLQEPGA
jgi:hypothetical protein